MASTAPTPAPATPLQALSRSPDPAAAAVSIIVFVLSLAGLPERLGLSNAAVTAIGSAVIFVAAAIRAVVRWRSGDKVGLQDPIAAALSAVLFALSLFGLPDLAKVDANTIATLASSIVMLATMKRATHALAKAEPAATEQNEPAAVEPKADQ